VTGLILLAIALLRRQSRSPIDTTLPDA